MKDTILAGVLFGLAFLGVVEFEWFDLFSNGLGIVVEKEENTFRLQVGSCGRRFHFETLNTCKWQSVLRWMSSLTAVQLVEHNDKRFIGLEDGEQLMENDEKK